MTKLKDVLISTSVNIGVMIAAIIIILVLMEAAFRLLSPQDLNPFHLDEKEWMKGTPDAEATYTKPEFKTSITLNSLGFRGDEPGLSNGYRILALGDSFTFGQGVNDEEAYAYLLEKKLNEDLNSADTNKRFSVMNAGMPGTSIDYGYNLYKREKEILKPNLVIAAIFLGNDITDVLNKQSFFVVEDEKLCWKNEIEISSTDRARAFLSQHSHLYNFVKNRVYYTPIRKIFNNLFSKQGKETTQPGFEFMIYDGQHPDAIEDGFKKTKMILSSMKKELDEDNVKMLMLVIPAKEEMDKEMQDQIVKTFNLKEPDFEYPHQRIVEMLEEEGIGYVDIASDEGYAENADEYYYSLDRHWTTKGHEFAADMLYDKIKGLRYDLVEQK